jgi:hypothetical protein
MRLHSYDMLVRLHYSTIEEHESVEELQTVGSIYSGLRESDGSMLGPDERRRGVCAECRTTARVFW